MQVALGACLALLTLDLTNAYISHACAHPGALATCYPRGTEGHAADYWYYRSKDTYLRSAVVEMFVVTSALTAPLFSRDCKRGVITMSIILVLGMTAHGYLGPAFL
jgi:hypothetical protein